MWSSCSWHHTSATGWTGTKCAAGTRPWRLSRLPSPSQCLRPTQEKQQILFSGDFELVNWSPNAWPPSQPEPRCASRSFGPRRQMRQCATRCQYTRWYVPSPICGSRRNSRYLRRGDHAREHEASVSCAPPAAGCRVDGWHQPLGNWKDPANARLSLPWQRRQQNHRVRVSALPLSRTDPAGSRAKWSPHRNGTAALAGLM